MNRLLQALGLMRVSEYERIVGKSFDEVRALCSHLWARHYRDEVPNWLPLDTLPGVISRLDNMTAGVSNDIDEMTAKFKKAITDLAAAREELTTAYSVMDRLNKQIIELTPDALAMRRKRERDRNRKAEKKEGGK